MLRLGHNAGIQTAISAPHRLLSGCFCRASPVGADGAGKAVFSASVEDEDIWYAKLGGIIELSLPGSCLSLEHGYFCVPKSHDSYSKIISRQNDPFWGGIGVVMCPQ